LDLTGKTSIQSLRFDEAQVLYDVNEDHPLIVDIVYEG
jgi:hypothetical protein